MNRRTFLKSTGASVSGLAVASTSAKASAANLDELPLGFFGAFEQIESASREQALKQCANALCVEDQLPNEETGEIGESLENINHQLRRVRFGIRTLNEYRITTAINESMVQTLEQDMRDYTRVVPLVGSFNHLQETACQVGSAPTDEHLQEFLYGLMSFGLEVGMWHSTAPYRMAWNGTRFVSNRTFLRYAREGCGGCIAFVMSELHWALRAVPYQLVSHDVVEFAYREIRDLAMAAREYGMSDVDLDFGRDELRRLVDQQSGVIIPGTMPDDQGDFMQLLKDNSTISIALLSVPVVYVIIRSGN